jgi:hypothetical protein
MFKALVTICSVYLPEGPCYNFEDITGLKPTIQACRERQQEMMTGIMAVPMPLPAPYTISFQCLLGEET